LVTGTLRLSIGRGHYKFDATSQRLSFRGIFTKWVMWFAANHDAPVWL